MRFTKIKANKKRVHLEWMTPAPGGGGSDYIEHTLESGDPPAPEFVQAMQALAEEVGELLEVESEWAEGLEVIGLSINYEDDGRRGLVVTCLKPLDGTNAPLVLNTPHLREPDADADGPALSEGMLRLLAAAGSQAAAYVKGQRAQGTLFPADDAELTGAEA